MSSAPSSTVTVIIVVTIAADRQMTTTAEGVETEQHRELLRAPGFAEMQGDLFRPDGVASRPTLLDIVICEAQAMKQSFCSATVIARAFRETIGCATFT